MVESLSMGLDRNLLLSYDKLRLLHLKLPQLILKNIIDYYRNKIEDHISLKNFERVI